LANFKVFKGKRGIILEHIASGLELVFIGKVFTLVVVCENAKAYSMK
jgi:hypothetical protein